MNKFNKNMKKIFLAFLMIFTVVAIFKLIFVPIDVYSMEIINHDVCNGEKEIGQKEKQKNNDIINLETTSITEFTNVKYIENKNYFLHNPKHAQNNTTDNPLGTCTTVAVQMMIGYHNYFTDRRLLPKIKDGEQFLDDDFGNLNFHPYFNRNKTLDQGCEKIGTLDSVYRKIIEKNAFSDNAIIGQTIFCVAAGAHLFIQDYSPIAHSVLFESRTFSKSKAHKDIDDGNPIVLVFSPIGSNADSFHVVTAYGYATLGEEDGFIVHYGWGDVNTHVWVPSSHIGFQIRMSVNHEHNFMTTTEYVINSGHVYGIKKCTICDYKCPVSAYETIDIGDNEVKIKKFLLKSFDGNLVIPTMINEKKVTKISDNAFSGCTSLMQVTIPSSVTNIGNHAFYNCTSLSQLSLPNSITRIRDFTFSNCTSLTQITIPSNVTHIDNYAFSNCTSLTQITIPSSVTHIGKNAFSNTNNAPIYLTGRTSVPSTFNALWNISKNPVYLNGQLCTHTNTTFTDLGSNHGQVCNKCRTVVSSSSHNYNSHVWLNYTMHTSSCSCGNTSPMPHVVSGGGGGFGFMTCLLCGGPAELGFAQNGSKQILNNAHYFGNGSYILTNGVIVLSDEDLVKFYNNTLDIPYELINMHRCECYHNCVNDNQTHLYLEERKDYISIR